MCEIEDIKARQILDSRGNPTVEVDVKLIDGTLGRASVPSGASTGIYEAKELRDNIKTEYLGKGVLRAVDNVNSVITPNLLGEEVFDQHLIDSLMMEMDGSFNKSTIKACFDLGYQTIMWTKDTIDWRDKDANLIYSRATNKLKGGDLILAHPTQSTLSALPLILEYFKLNNFEATTVSNCLK